MPTPKNVLTFLKKHGCAVSRVDAVDDGFNVLVKSDPEKVLEVWSGTAEQCELHISEINRRARAMSWLRGKLWKRK